MTTPKPLTPPSKKETGPTGLRALSAADGEIPQTADDVFDTSIMANIIPRQYKTAPFAEPVLALEVTDGPYKGVVFGFTAFTMLPQKMDDGMVPTKFETTVYAAPKSFDKDESFDHYCRELLLAWLHFIAVNDLGGLIRAEAHKGIQ